MKCSKCGYVGFESGDRCRNCGYEFSLSADYELPDLDLKDSSSRGPDDAVPGLDDFALVDAGAAPRSMSASAVSALSAAAMTEPPRPLTRTPPVSMPLFAPGIDDDTPLITKPSPPRAPLSVRKSTPDMARLRSVTPAPKAASPDLGLDFDVLDAQAAPRLVPAERAQSPGLDPPEYEDAGVARRLLAAFVDSLILLAVDIVVIYFTMQICGVGLDEFDLLPKGPLVAFLVVQNVGYLVAFTAGGQTLGKMTAGIKVVSDDADVPLDLGAALKRTVMWLVLAFPAGLGLLSALFARDHRGLHDRFAGTRVVRAAV